MAFVRMSDSLPGFCFCEIHNGAELTIYCMDHKCLACKTCHGRKHRRCQTVPTEDQAKKSLPSILVTNGIRAATQLLQQACSLRNSRKLDKEKLEASVKESQVDIKRLKTRLVKHFDALAKSLGTLLDTLSAKLGSEIDDDISIFENLIKDIEKQIEILNYSRDYDQTTKFIAHTQVKQQIDEFKETVNELETDSESKLLKFNPNSKIDQLLKDVPEFGEIVVTDLAGKRSVGSSEGTGHQETKAENKERGSDVRVEASRVSEGAGTAMKHDQEFPDIFMTNTGAERGVSRYDETNKPGRDDLSKLNRYLKVKATRAAEGDGAAMKYAQVFPNIFLTNLCGAKGENSSDGANQHGKKAVSKARNRLLRVKAPRAGGDVGTSLTYEHVFRNIFKTKVGGVYSSDGANVHGRLAVSKPLDRGVRVGETLATGGVGTSLMDDGKSDEFFQFMKGMRVEKSLSLHEIISWSRIGLVTGCAFLPDDSLILCIHSNKTILHCSDTFMYMSELILPSRPWDITAISNQEVVVTLSGEQQLQFVTTVRGLQLDRSVQLDRHCYGVDHFNDKLYVTCHDGGFGGGRGQVIILDMTGKVLNRVGDGSLFQKPGCICVNEDGTRVHVSDSVSHEIICLSEAGQIIYRSKVENLVKPIGMCLDGGAHLAVCGMRSNNVVVLGKDGEYVCGLVDEKNGVRYPWCVTFRARDGVLVVGINPGVKLYWLK